MFKELFTESEKMSKFEKDFDVLIRNLGFKFKGRDSDSLDKLLVYNDPLTNRSIYVQDTDERSITIGNGEYFEGRDKFDFLVKKWKGKWIKDENHYLFKK